MSRRDKRPDDRRSLGSFLGDIAKGVMSELSKPELADHYSDENGQYDDNKRQRNRGGQEYDEEEYGYSEQYRPAPPRSSSYMTEEEEEAYKRVRKHFGSRDAEADLLEDRLHPDYVGRGRGNIQASQSSEVRRNSDANSRLGGDRRRENSTERDYRSRSRRPSSVEPGEATSGVSLYSSHHRRRDGEEGFCVIELRSEHPKKNLTCSYATDDSGDRAWMCTACSKSEGVPHSGERCL